MRLSTVKAAKEEARRLIKTIDAAVLYKVVEFDRLADGKETAAVRRASMDLSRVLSKLRANK